MRIHHRKALVHSHQGFFFVDKRFEISNLDLKRDMAKIFILEEEL
jgi:hypothetical protein